MLIVLVIAVPAFAGMVMEKLSEALMHIAVPTMVSCFLLACSYLLIFSIVTFVIVIIILFVSILTAFN
jgi:hypothetical protein